MAAEINNQFLVAFCAPIQINPSREYGGRFSAKTL